MQKERKRNKKQNKTKVQYNEKQQKKNATKFAKQSIQQGNARQGPCGKRN